MKGMLGPNKVQVAGLWMKLQHEELHNLCLSPTVIILFKSAKIGQKRNVEPAWDRAKFHGENIGMKT